MIAFAAAMYVFFGIGTAAAVHADRLSRYDYEGEQPAWLHALIMLGAFLLWPVLFAAIMGTLLYLMLEDVLP